MRLLALICAATALAVPAHAQTVRITKLNDFAFGTLGSPGASVTLTDDVCTYSTSLGYRVTVTGSGSSGAFSLASGGNRLPLGVQWASSAGQSVGTALSHGVPLAASTSNWLDSSCLLVGPNATLIVTIGASDNGSAMAGNYTGSLTVLLAPN